jgi:hypothetical protein
MPSPDGCYVQVWAQPQFMGPFDYINGPQSYADLWNMPHRLNWDNRIVSVRSGPTAIATAYTERNFQGASLQLGERKDFATLPKQLDRTISSLHVRCADASGR